MGALLKEMASYREAVEGYTIDTIYFGGGTPSLLSPAQLARLLDGARVLCPIAPDAEITMEANPATVTAETLAAYRRAGVNRLSIGVQSFAAEELKALGRLHTAEEAKESVRLARAAGFDRISIDLMYGIPHQTLGSFAYSLREAVSLRPAHISAYALKIEEGTPFYRSQADLPLPDEDTEVAMYDLCHDILSQNGYTQYEVSNYALQGEESRHNLRYWRSAEYIGVGVSAYSYFGGYRYGNDRDLTAYLTRDFSYTPHGEAIDEREAEYEMIMLSLRLADGLSHTAFETRFHKSFPAVYGDALAPFIAAGLVVQDARHTALTHKGLYLMNYILTAILS